LLVGELRSHMPRGAAKKKKVAEKAKGQLVAFWEGGTLASMSCKSERKDTRAHRQTQ